MLYAGVAAAVAGGGYYFYNQGDNAAKVKGAAKDAEDKAKSAIGQGKAKAEGALGKAAFTGGDQGFISLRLESVENVNHNTKKFRFQLPEGDQVSGLKVASALLTKYKGPEMEKAAIRPYTPVSDEGMLFTSLRCPIYLPIIRGEWISRSSREAIPKWSYVYSSTRNAPGTSS